MDYYFENQKSNLLIANFYKYYDNIPNKYESYYISFFVINGEAKLNSVIISKDFNFQNNELIISSDEAINIAKNKENEFSDYEITNINSELAFEKMNAYIYKIENDKFDEEDFYVTDDVTRKVWKIKVEHGLLAKDFGIERKNEYLKEGMSKYYYVDVTTGEIIGGERVIPSNN